MEALIIIVVLASVPVICLISLIRLGKRRKEVVWCADCNNYMTYRMFKSDNECIVCGSGLIEGTGEYVNKDNTPVRRLGYEKLADELSDWFSHSRENVGRELANWDKDRREVDRENKRRRRRR